MESVNLELFGNRCSGVMSRRHLLERSSIISRKEGNGNYHHVIIREQE